MGAEDKAVQESVEAGETMRSMQAPNRRGVWSRSQQPREKAMVGPRFEQTIMADQVSHALTTNDETHGHETSIWKLL